MLAIPLSNSTDDQLARLSASFDHSGDFGAWLAGLIECEHGRRILSVHGDRDALTIDASGLLAWPACRLRDAIFEAAQAVARCDDAHIREVLAEAAGALAAALSAKASYSQWIKPQ